jgi:hypothetical protein
MKCRHVKNLNDNSHGELKQKGHPAKWWDALSLLLMYEAYFTTFILRVSLLLAPVSVYV